MPLKTEKDIEQLHNRHGGRLLIFNQLFLRFLAPIKNPQKSPTLPEVQYLSGESICTEEHFEKCHLNTKHYRISSA